jgi:hypothetical protein
VIDLLTAIGLTPGGSSTVHIRTQTIHRTTQNKQYIEQHKNFGRVRAVPRLISWLVTEIQFLLANLMLREVTSKMYK